MKVKDVENSDGQSEESQDLGARSFASLSLEERRCSELSIVLLIGEEDSDDPSPGPFTIVNCLREVDCSRLSRIVQAQGILV